MDTIVAIATSLASSAGINIIRISGEDSLRIAREIFQNKNIKDGVFEPNYMYLGTINAEQFSEKAFCVYFKAPKSYTGEDVAELHCHGGIGIAKAVARLVCEHGARPARPGEFTKRAFLNNKLNLVEAEGILEMINASSEAEMRNAYRLLSGEISKEISRIESLIVETIAMLEAKLDYPEELEEDTKPASYENLLKIKSQLEKHVENANKLKNVRHGINIAIVGAPNAGKSSLLNALIREDRAIVTDIAGTTRDVISESVEYKGIKLNFLDTAGIRESKNVIEEMGIERSKKAINGADIVIFVKDLSVIESEEENEIKKLLEGKTVIEVGNKLDIKTAQKSGLEISVKENINIDKIFDLILEKVNAESVFGQPVLTNERQIFALEECLNRVNDAINIYFVMPSECVLVDLHDAAISLAQITGKDVTESVVDQVFSAFCVGK